MKWRNNVPKCAKVISGGDVYQFGVFTGGSMKIIANSFQKSNIPIRKMFGFDSFIGLPEESNDTYNHPHWKKGVFDTRKRFNLKTVEQCVKHVRKIIGKRKYKVELIPGFFDVSLSKETIKKYDLKPASYVDIDCDQYSSTLTVLDFMFKNKLIRKGTLIGYDDWGGTPEFFGGESRAHMEIEKKYNVKFEKVYDNFNKETPIKVSPDKWQPICHQVVFLVHSFKLP